MDRWLGFKDIPIGIYYFALSILVIRKKSWRYFILSVFITNFIGEQICRVSPSLTFFFKFFFFVKCPHIPYLFLYTGHSQYPHWSLLKSHPFSQGFSPTVTCKYWAEFFDPPETWTRSPKFKAECNLCNYTFAATNATGADEWWRTLAHNYLIDRKETVTNHHSSS